MSWDSPLVDLNDGDPLMGFICRKRKQYVSASMLAGGVGVERWKFRNSKRRSGRVLNVNTM